MKAITLCGIICLVFSLNTFADSAFVKFGSRWKYLDDGSAPAATWITGSFNDSAWASGLSAFGFVSPNIRTQISYGGNAANKHITTYFRKSISISNVANFSFFRLNLYLDDGIIVYVNGKEALRIDMPAGAVQNFIHATNGQNDKSNFITSQIIKSSFFRNGVNDIAVEVHQSNRQSRTMMFDFELTGITGSSSPEVSRGPYLQKVTSGGITIRWKTNSACASTVWFGPAENELTASVSDPSEVVDHEVTINGLKPDTRYYYAIGTASTILRGSYRNSFSTAPPATTTRKIRIGVIGDAGTGDFNQKRSRDRYLETYQNGVKPDIALFLGDNAYPLGTERDYQTGFFSIYNDNLFNDHTVFPVPGNHEYAGAAHISDITYYNVFTLPKSGESGGLASGTESYYSFNYGNIHFVMLNSYGFDAGTLLQDTLGQQAQWLKKDLAANAGKSKWTVACFHHPPYSNANHYSDGEQDLTIMRERLTPILERFGVDLVLAGHSHSYERSFLIQNHTGKSNTFNPLPPPTGNLVNGSSAKYDGTSNSCPYVIPDVQGPHGTMYVVAGGAGQLGGGNNPKWPLFYYRNYSATPDADCGILTLEVEENRIDGKYVGANTGNVLDRFTLIKKSNSSKQVVTEVNTPVKLSASWPGNYHWTPSQNAIKQDSRSLTFTPATSNTFTYVVTDNADANLRCLSDTFTIRSYAAVLAANVEFTAEQKNNDVFLKWTTAQEINTFNFVIERSTNGADYTEIGSVMSMGTSAVPVTYTFDDKTALSGKNYYRLTRVAVGGNRTELGVRIVQFAASYGTRITPKSNPMPASDVELTIMNNRRQILDLNVVDMQGKSAFSRQFTIAEGKTIMPLKLRAGTYIVTGRTMDGLIASEKIVVY